MTQLVPPGPVGLYRDDGIMALNKSGPELDKLRKTMHELFKNFAWTKNYSGDKCDKGKFSGH